MALSDDSPDNRCTFLEPKWFSDQAPFLPTIICYNFFAFHLMIPLASWLQFSISTSGKVLSILLVLVSSLSMVVIMNIYESEGLSKLLFFVFWWVSLCLYCLWDRVASFSFKFHILSYVRISSISQLFPDMDEYSISHSLSENHIKETHKQKITQFLDYSLLKMIY